MKNTIFLAGFLAIGSFSSILGMSEDVPGLDKGQEALKKLDENFEAVFNDYVDWSSQDTSALPPGIRDEFNADVQRIYQQVQTLALQGAQVDFTFDVQEGDEDEEDFTSMSSLDKLIFMNDTAMLKLLLEHGAERTMNSIYNYRVKYNLSVKTLLENQPMTKLLMSYNVLKEKDLPNFLKRSYSSLQLDHKLYKKDWQNAYIILRVALNVPQGPAECIMEFVGPKKMKTFAEQAAWNHQHAFDCQQGRRKKYLESQSSAVSKSTSKTIASKKFIDKDDTKHDDDGNVAEPKGLI